MLSSSLRIGHRIKKILTTELRHDAKYHKWLGQICCQDVINANQLKWRGDLSNNDLPSKTKGGKNTISGTTVNKTLEKDTKSMSTIWK